MNLTIVLIVFMTLALVMGPWLWLRPSPRDRQQERLRVHARKVGLEVGVKFIADPDPLPQDRVSGGGRVLEPTREVAVYSRSVNLPRDLDPEYAPAWSVVRMRPDQDGAEKVDHRMPSLLPGWRLAEPGLPLVESVIASLSALLAKAPRGTVMVEAGARSARLYWRERGDVDEVDRIAALLAELVDYEIGLARDAERQAMLIRQAEEADAESNPNAETSAGRSEND